MPKVSVVIPVYNVEKYLRECLDSVINQTLKDIEIICVDDGSTDSSLEILKEYAAKDSRIKIITQQNQHAGVARNNGLEAATGEFVHFLDSDDRIELDAYEKLYQRITDTNAQICIFKNSRYKETTGELIPCKWGSIIEQFAHVKSFSKYDIPENYFQISNMPAWTKLYRTSFIKENNIMFQNLKTCNDVYFNYMSLALANKITFLDETLIIWRDNPTNTTATREKHINCILLAFKSIKKDLNPKILKLLSDTFYTGARKCFSYEIKKIKDPERKKYYTLKLFSFLPPKYWTDKAIKIKKEKYKKLKNFAENVFSIKDGKRHKILCFLGIKLKIKNEKLEYKIKV